MHKTLSIYPLSSLSFVPRFLSKIIAPKSCSSSPDSFWTTNGFRFIEKRLDRTVGYLRDEWQLYMLCNKYLKAVRTALLAKALACLLNFPFVIADATTLNQATIWIPRLPSKVRISGSMVPDEQPHAMLISLKYFIMGYGLNRASQFIDSQIEQGKNGDTRVTSEV
ncbi:hypothetical protein L2E82_30257 [Cichorium intybus]|uniref:Uncharacterized protein n=1 Tax=Cichorium intybus TaxID=13427 RepID=A0ACB9CZW4_CICIN|nr:hypothetical protein L2E82_30257 [Cichorium intybus]